MTRAAMAVPRTALLLSTTALLAATACTAPVAHPVAPPNTAPVPDLGLRPAVLPLDGIDPCVLLTPGQLRQLQLNPGRGGDTPGTGHPACNWDTDPRKPDDNWTAIVKTSQPAGAALRGEGAELIHIGGFPTVQTSSAFGGRERICTLLIDVAPGQSLTVGYDNTDKDRPGISHEVACQQAVRVAEPIVATLRTLVR